MYVLVLFDNILIAAKTISENDSILRQVLKWLFLTKALL